MKKMSGIPKVDWDAERTADGWLKVGEFLLTKKRWRDAARAFRNSIKKHDNDCIPWRWLGISHLNLGEYEEALEAFSRAVSIKDDYGSAWAYIGLVYRNLRKDDKANEAFSKALEVGHKEPPVLFYVGEWLYRMGQLEEALKLLDQCVEIHPKGYQPWLIIAKANSELGRYDAAWKAAEMLVKVKPDFAKGWLVYGELLTVQGGTLDEAEKAFKKAVELEPELAMGWYSLGTVYAKQEIPGKASEMFQKAITLDSALEEDMNEFYDSACHSTIANLHSSGYQASVNTDLTSKGVCVAILSSVPLVSLSRCIFLSENLEWNGNLLQRTCMFCLLKSFLMPFNALSVHPLTV